MINNILNKKDMTDELAERLDLQIKESLKYVLKQLPFIKEYELCIETGALILDMNYHRNNFMTNATIGLCFDEYKISKLFKFTPISDGSYIITKAYPKLVEINYNYKYGKLIIFGEDAPKSFFDNVNKFFNMKLLMDKL